LITAGTVTILVVPDISDSSDGIDAVRSTQRVKHKDLFRNGRLHIYWRVADLRWYHRAVVSVICVLVAIDLTLISSGGHVLVTPDLSIFLTGVAIFLFILAIVVWLYRKEPYAESDLPSNPGESTDHESRRPYNPGEWTDDGSRRLDSQAKEDVSRDIKNITDSGYYKDRRYFGGYDPRVNRPKKD
jgi:hypothetical protein